MRLLDEISRNILIRKDYMFKFLSFLTDISHKLLLKNPFRKAHNYFRFRILRNLSCILCFRNHSNRNSPIELTQYINFLIKNYLFKFTNFTCVFLLLCIDCFRHTLHYFDKSGYIYLLLPLLKILLYI